VNFFEFETIAESKVKEVYSLLVQERVFNPRHIYQEVDWWFRMQISEEYYSLPAEELASHIHCFMAAKKLAKAIGDEALLFSKKESSDKRECVYLCPFTYMDSVKVERDIEQFIEKQGEGSTITIKHLASQKPFLPHGKECLSIYMVEATPGSTDGNFSSETSLCKIASSTFLSETSYEVRSMLQKLLTMSSAELYPYSNVHPMKDGTILASLTLKHKSQTPFLLRTTEILKATKLRCSRKFMGTFATGVTVCAYYLQTNDVAAVNDFLQKAKLISVVSGRTLSPYFLDGSLTAEEFAYASSVRKFVYFFMNTTDEDSLALIQVLQRDSANVARLNRLRSKLRREAVSTVRMAACIGANIPLVKQLYEHFVHCCNEGPYYSIELAKQVAQNAGNIIDVQIMMSFLIFNSSLTKTNFWKDSKASLAFSFSANFVVDRGFPYQPYSILFIMGAEFQGFHVRFQDTASGGIRVIHSADAPSYIRNLEGQFTETYDMALSQQKQNKDLPEFGAQGTILLNKYAQMATDISIQKYISGILDLALSLQDPQVIDHTKKEDLIFFSNISHNIYDPAMENISCSLLQWAISYAKQRGYPYWKSFATHRMLYNLTMGCSIRTYIEGCLEMCHLKEEEITKVQYGGPSDPEAKAQIIKSRDKTIAMMDRSGVLYDSRGIDRNELLRLVHSNQPISFFDISKLGPDGFLVLETDTNLTLPNGEFVEMGREFCKQFLMHPLATADIFLACGLSGTIPSRNSVVNLTSVKQWLHEDGNPKYKIMVEGVSLFFSSEARKVLEKSGSILYKHHYTTKGEAAAVSFETLLGLVLTDQEYTTHVWPGKQDAGDESSFFNRYLNEVMHYIRESSYSELILIWKESERTGTTRSELASVLYDKISKLKEDISQSTLFENEDIRNKVLARAFPKSLQELVPLKEIMRRLPSSYMRAIFDSSVAFHFTYTHGLHPSEFSFFEFIHALKSKKEPNWKE